MKLSAITLALLLLAGCASNTAPAVTPNKEVKSCLPHEHYVCTKRTASRTERQHDDMEFCRCERIEEIR